MNETEAFLKNFHLENPGCTPACFANGRMDGMDSYSFLSSILNEADKGKTVVDLACGDGTLIQKILSQRIDGLKIIGIDMSAGELNLAKKKVRASEVQFVEAKAQTLPIENCSVHFIFCHMALMLMEEIETVISEVHRCLKPRAVFSAIVGGKSEASPVFKSFLGLLKQALVEENKSFLTHLGDRRTKSPEGLKSLFHESDFANTEIKDLQLTFSGRPSECLDFFMLMYDVALLSNARRDQLRSELLHVLESDVDESGFVQHFLWLRQVTTRKK